jgi:hypothetical protein
MTSLQANPSVTIAQGWLGEALSSDLTLTCAAIFLVSLIVITFLIRAMARLGKPQRIARQANGQTSSLAALLKDDRGTTSIEFALVFPMLLFFSLLLTQTMMLMAGNMYTHYSAFIATRQAIMEIPRDAIDDGGLEANIYTEGGDKHEAIRKAAYLALLPIAGQEGSGSGQGRDVESAIERFYDMYDRDAPAWVESMVAAKVSYAERHTTIEVLETRIIDQDTVEFDSLPGGDYRFGARDPITVRVMHKINLGVPIVSRIFSDGEHDGKGPGRYTQVAARFTLTNEGVPVPLPEKPDIDRVTQTLPVISERDQQWLDEQQNNGN